MTLSEYIKQVGRAAFCKKFKVKDRTAYSWELLDRYPNKTKAQEIVRKSPVTFEGIYGVRKEKPDEVVA